MKLLPCQHCKRPAISRPSARFPKGQPLLTGGFQGGRISYKCSRCKKVSFLTPQGFRRLPNLTPEDLTSLGFPDLAAVLTEHLTQSDSDVVPSPQV